MLFWTGLGGPGIAGLCSVLGAVCDTFPLTCLLAHLLLLTCSLSYCRNSLGLNWTLSGAVECEGPLYPSEESLRELGISGPTLLHCSDQDA